MLHVSDSNQDWQVVHNHWKGKNYKGYKDNNSPTVANIEQEDYDKGTVMFGNGRLITASLFLTIKEEMHEMIFWLMFNQIAVEKVVEDQGINSPEILASLSGKNITAEAY